MPNNSGIYHLSFSTYHFLKIFRNRRDQVDPVVGELRESPGERQADDEEHRQQLRHERDGLLLHLRQSLQQPDDEPDDHADRERRRRENQRQHDGIAAQVDGVLNFHIRNSNENRTESRRRVGRQVRAQRRRHENAWKLSINMPTIRCQPSIITNSSSLNGSEINTGGNIIMPIAMSTLETTMSMIRNGK